MSVLLIQLTKSFGWELSMHETHSTQAKPAQTKIGIPVEKLLLTDMQPGGGSVRYLPRVWKPHQLKLLWVLQVIKKGDYLNYHYNGTPLLDVCAFQSSSLVVGCLFFWSLSERSHTASAMINHFSSSFTFVHTVFIHHSAFSQWYFCLVSLP